MRLAVSRPLAAAAARSTAARAFSTTALRAKEIAGENTETPNMRVGSCICIASSWP
jgi:NADH dehydrogenase (ubiquinone) Fe-S protein 3